MFHRSHKREKTTLIIGNNNSWIKNTDTSQIANNIIHRSVEGKYKKIRKVIAVIVHYEH